MGTGEGPMRASRMGGIQLAIGISSGTGRTTSCSATSAIQHPSSRECQGTQHRVASSELSAVGAEGLAVSYGYRLARPVRSSSPSRTDLNWTCESAICDEGTGLATTDSTVIRNHADFIWSVADLLRGDHKQSEYGKVIVL